MNATHSPDETSFLLAHCPRCAQEVLVARELNPQHELIEVCVHCGDAVDLTRARWVDANAVAALDYLVPEAQKSQGERGCRGGQCGVRQPRR